MGDPVAVTGVGLLTPAGEDAAACHARLVAGEAAASPVQVPGFPAVEGMVAGQIVDVSPERYLKDRKALKYMDRLSKMAVRAAGHALADAGLDLAGLDARGVGLSMAVGHVAADLSDFLPVIASGRAPDGSFDAAAMGRSNRINPIAVFKTLSNIPVCNVSITLGLKGDNLILYPDAPQAARALEEGAWSVRDAAAEVVLSGGVASAVDFLNLHRRAMLERAADARRAERGEASLARPPGADGAVVLVLESGPRARARGARVRGWVRGCGFGGGGGDVYLAAPEAGAFAQAALASLAAAGARVEDVAMVVGGAMPGAHRVPEREGLARADLGARPLVFAGGVTGDMATASFAFGVHLALDLLARGAVPASLLAGPGGSGATDTAGAGAARDAGVAGEVRLRRDLCFVPEGRTGSLCSHLDAARRVALVMAVGHQGDVACVAVERGDAR